jgi:hypothetical protein
MDIERAFNQVPIAEEDIEKFAFIVDNKLYEPVRMPFGSMNAPATFQRLIDRVLSGLTWQMCLVNIDDVIIFSKNFNQHLLDIKEVLKRFRLANLKLNPEKCVFGKDEVSYLGFRINATGLHSTTEKIDAILSFTQLLKVNIEAVNASVPSFLHSFEAQFIILF